MEEKIIEVATKKLLLELNKIAFLQQLLFFILKRNNSQPNKETPKGRFGIFIKEWEL